MNILITGGAGFIGFHLTKYLLKNRSDIHIVSIDNLNDYYDTQLKINRVEELKSFDQDRLTFKRADINDRVEIQNLFEKYSFTYVINLAAQAGVRYAAQNPDSYVKSNIDGFYVLISEASKHNVTKFIYASSSSVYGANTSMPFEEIDKVGTPMSLYAASKLADESIASAYFYTHKIQTVGLRFFNVYGPWGRPDMAYYKWTSALLAGEDIELRNNGEMWRDMTYVEDVVKVIDKLMNDKVYSSPEVFNVGNQEPVKISDLLNYISTNLGVLPTVNNQPKGEEEPVKTWASTEKLSKDISFVPQTDFIYGLEKFLDWYKDYHKLDELEIKI